MAIMDVTIYGAGIFGLSVAWSCAARGAKVRVIDPNGVGAGSSGGLVGALAPHVPERWNAKKAFQFDSLIMAEDYWAKVESVSGLSSGYGRTGRLQPIADDRALTLARDRKAEAASLWQGKAVWDVRPVTDFAGWAPDSPTGYLIHDTLTARMNPRLASKAIADAVCAKGGEVVGEGREEGRIVWATGWQGLLALSHELGKPVGNGVKGQSALLRHGAADLPQLFADTLHIIPHANGTVAIGSTSEREFEDPSGCDAALDDVIARAREVCPAIAEAPVIERWAGVRPRAKSRAPMLGHYPGRPDHFIANGGFKIGFGMGPKVGEVMADLVLDGCDTIPNAFRVEASL
ncbi:FAD-dependent oxidoreductase [Aliiroseovarius sp. F47248L]|uniref:NAD(P)/FAD-dependent oxidoreductase n=1 Tax=Aliiroseovarius sp. F47248L TaxID=2926420 RepID=UPI001FF0E1D9|nr:FAD-dependent oxidoreductase [Aliiroseovarius sp. F47248L]MCK0140400.1 FAD-binding oxidoreductase [Aliiroseovarius sp. F47248L]